MDNRGSILGMGNDRIFSLGFWGPPSLLSNG
jgi:hypothetical protein